MIRQLFCLCSVKRRVPINYTHTHFTMLIFHLPEYVGGKRSSRTTPSSWNVVIVARINITRCIFEFWRQNPSLFRLVNNSAPFTELLDAFLTTISVCVEKPSGGQTNFHAEVPYNLATVSKTCLSEARKSSSHHSAVTYPNLAWTNAEIGKALEKSITWSSLINEFLVAYAQYKSMNLKWSVVEGHTLVD
jgi:hypothetical protein